MAKAKKIKGIDKAIEKFNNWPATARIYLDTACGRVWTETFVNAKEGRYVNFGKESIVEIHNKEGLYNDGVTTDKETLLCKIKMEQEEMSYHKNRRRF